MPTDPKPKKRPGRPPGTKTDSPSPNTARVYFSLTPAQKKRLERRALEHRHANDLPSRWGVSDLVRELVLAYLEAPPKEPT